MKFRETRIKSRTPLYFAAAVVAVYAFLFPLNDTIHLISAILSAFFVYFVLYFTLPGKTVYEKHEDTRLKKLKDLQMCIKDRNILEKAEKTI